VQSFQIQFLEPANRFIARLDPKIARKLLYNIRLSQHTIDPRLFKKLRDEIWEFRTRQGSSQIRLLAFWDKMDNQNTLVFVTHGFIKKQGKLPDNEIERAKIIRKKYFDAK
jgi:phage-related protein